MTYRGFCVGPKGPKRCQRVGLWAEDQHNGAIVRTTMGAHNGEDMLVRAQQLVHVVVDAGGNFLAWRRDVELVSYH